MSFSIFNGVDGDNGSYDLPPMHVGELVGYLRGEITPENLSELKFRARQASTQVLGLREGLDPTNISEAGWGAIFPAYPASDPERDQKERRVAAIREALQPLLRLRQEQAGERFQEWCQGINKGFHVEVDTKNTYLGRQGAGPGPADPERVPYYLLIVGDPAEIPYRFQSQLDVQYAVGRIYFETLDEYAAYAASVVAAETGLLKFPRRAAFFGVANPGDRATEMSASLLASPLAEKVRAAHPEWVIQSIAPEQATKGRLATLLGGGQTPALLFTASHGMRLLMAAYASSGTRVRSSARTGPARRIGLGQSRRISIFPERTSAATLTCWG